LRAVNAPSISDSDFARLYKGKLAEVIDLVAHSVVGRGEATAARAMIQQQRDSSTRMKPQSHQETDPLYNDSKRSEARSKSARILVESEQKTRAAEQSQKHDLQLSLEDKRLTSLLLSILERKEKIRKERFAEIAKLIEDLRYVVCNILSTSTQPESLSLKATMKPPRRTEYTNDVLAALQAHSLRVSHIAASANGQPSPSRVQEAERRLLQAVALSKGVTVDVAEVSYQELLTLGRNQALQRVRYKSPIPAEREMEDIEEITQRISEKEAELQRLADHSAALTLACAQSLQVVSHFVKEATPALRDSLQEEAGTAQGHTDTLRLSVVNRLRAPAGCPPGESLSGGQTLPATISNLERTVKRAQATEAFTRDVNRLISPDPAKVEEHAALIESHNAEEAEVSGRITRLLERKAKKAAVGQTLVQDIERLVAETASIAVAK
ncbi:hypothetical protein C8T65DRAFT_565055, partial [Cerioporus squamosus]